MVKRQQYWYAIDWWSLGVVLFEILNGHRPFIADDEKTLMKNIAEVFIFFKKNDVNYITVLSCDAKNFISDLLQKDPEVRFIFL